MSSPIKADYNKGAGYANRYRNQKIGAFLGDGVEVGCGSVLNPGTIVGRNSNIYPLSSVRGFVPAGSIYKNKTEIVEKINKAH